MASPEALEQVAFEAAEDAHADGALLAEFRIAPLLFEAHGVPGEAVIEALLAGLKRSKLHSGLIVCGMRHLPPEETQRAARLALRYQGKLGNPGHAGHQHPCGVVGFDLAGAEFGHPPAEHEAAITLVRDAGMALTLHAGEADAAERVLQAARLGATRIGHGVRLADALSDPARRHLVDEAIALDVHLEVCPTSNVHTGAAASIATHPITALWRAGLSLSYHTDNRLMSCITHSGEAAELLRHTPLKRADLLAMAATVGVTRAVQIGCDLPSARWTVGAIDTHPALVGGVALHPNEAPRLAERGQLADAMAEIASLATHPRIRTIGETGLDYFRTGDDGRAVQHESFRWHIDLAKRRAGR